MNINTGAVAAMAASASDIVVPATGKRFHLLPVPTPALPEWQRRVAAWART